MMKRKVIRNGIVLLALILAGSFLAVANGLAADAPTKEKPIVWKVQTPWPISLWNHKTADNLGQRHRRDERRKNESPDVLLRGNCSPLRDL